MLQPWGFNRGFGLFMLGIAAVGCAPPERDFTESSGTGAGGAGGSSATSTTSAAGSTGGFGSSSAASSNAASSSSSSGGGNCMTDADQDGAISAVCKGGADCADEDFNAHPDPTIDFQSIPIQGATAPGTLPFDFNCDGAETVETLVLKCALLCMGSDGYEAAVKCGQTAPLGRCDPVACKWVADSPPKSRVQRCK